MKFVGLLKVIERQAHNIEEMKSLTKTIQAHVISHTVWRRETNKELALIPLIKDNQELLMLHIAGLIKSLTGDEHLFDVQEHLFAEFATPTREV